MEVNYSREPSCLDCLSFEKEPLKNILVITISSIAVGILLGAAFGVLTCTPLGLPVALGFASGSFLAITLFMYTLCTSSPKEIYNNSNTENQFSNNINEIEIQLPPRVIYNSFPENFPSDLLTLFFSSTNFSLRTFRALACLSKDCHKIVRTLNEERIKKVAKIAKYIGWEAWEGYGWKFADTDDKYPLIFPNILNIANGGKTILLIPENANLKSIGDLAEKQLSNNGPYRDLSPKIHKSKLFKKNHMTNKAYYVIMTTCTIKFSDGNNNEQHCKQVIAFEQPSKFHYRFSKVLEVVALTFLHEFVFKECLFINTKTRCLEKTGNSRICAGNYRENSICIDTFDDHGSYNLGIVPALSTESSIYETD